MFITMQKILHTLIFMSCIIIYWLIWFRKYGLKTRDYIIWLYRRSSSGLTWSVIKLIDFLNQVRVVWENVNVGWRWGWNKFTSNISWGSCEKYRIKRLCLIENMILDVIQYCLLFNLPPNKFLRELWRWFLVVLNVLGSWIGIEFLICCSLLLILPDFQLQQQPNEMVHWTWKHRRWSAPGSFKFEEAIHGCEKILSKISFNHVKQVLKNQRDTADKYQRVMVVVTKRYSWQKSKSNGCRLRDYW